MASTQEASRTLVGAAERTATAVRDTVVIPAEAILAIVDRIAVMRLPADIQASVTREISTLAGEMRLKLIRETESLRHLGQTLERFERRLMMEKSNDRTR